MIFLTQMSSWFICRDKMSLSDLKMNFQMILKVIQDENSKSLLVSLELMKIATRFEQLEVFTMN